MAITFTERYVDASASGGGTGTQASPWTWDEALQNAAAGDRVNVKAGTYSTVNQTSSATGTQNNPIVFRGYTSTIGDLDDVDGWLDSATEVPVIQQSAYGGGFRSGNNYIFMDHINVEVGPYGYAAEGFNFRVGFGAARRCKFSVTGTAGSGGNAINCVRANSDAVFLDCYFSNTGTGYHILYEAGLVDGCVFEGTGSSIGATAIRSCFHTSNSLFYNCNGLTFEYATQEVKVRNCTFYNPTQGGTAIEETGAAYTRIKLIRNNVFVNQNIAVKSIYGSGDNVAFLVDGNAYFNCATQLDQIAYQYNGVTLTSDPFVDSANKDFTISNSSPIYAKGFPRKQIGFYDDNGLDMGAIQHTDPTITPAFHPLGQ